MKIYQVFLMIAAIIVATALAGCPGPGRSGSDGNGTSGNNGASQELGNNGVTGNESGPDETEEVSLRDLGRGVQVWKAQNCTTCHRIGDDPGGETAPNLTGVGDRYTKNQLKDLLRDPKSQNPDAKMPPQAMSEEDLEYLARYLSVVSSDLNQTSPSR